MDGACARDIECYKVQGDEDPAKQIEEQLPAREAETKTWSPDVFQGKAGGHLWRCRSAGIWALSTGSEKPGSMATGASFSRDFAVIETENWAVVEWRTGARELILK